MRAALRSNSPLLIGIVGDSGTGKTTFARGLAQVLGSDRAVVICMDDYHRYSRRQRATMNITPHDPACNYLDILEQHVDLLRDGQPILKPIYNHNGGTLDPPEYVEPREFIIFEGLLGYYTPRLRDSFDIKMFMDPAEPLRLRWKFQRDTGYGGYTPDQVMASLDKLQRDSVQYIMPQREYADVIVCFYPPDEMPEEMGGRLCVRHMLRPTLPSLDLSPILEAGTDKGFLLELARDVDGRPVDALHVVCAPGAAAADMEAYLWSRLPIPERERPQLGAYLDASNAVQFSRPLALSQLLISHYVLQAELVEHAT